VSDFSVNGICVCNGYAGNCTVDDGSGLYRCDCLNGTCGAQCDRCCPLFNNVPYVNYGEGCEGVCLCVHSVSVCVCVCIVCLHTLTCCFLH